MNLMSSIAKSFPPLEIFVLKMLIVAVVLDPEFQMKERSTQVQSLFSGAVAMFPTLLPLILTSSSAEELFTTFIIKKLKV